jgi:zinc transporter 1/2/3
VSLGGNFVRSGFTFNKAVLLLLSFALSTPLGVAIGLGLSEESILVSSILLSLSVGTFVYVSCTEIIQSEFERGFP